MKNLTIRHKAVEYGCALLLIGPSRRSPLALTQSPLMAKLGSGHKLDARTNTLPNL